jgi:tetratricopeptide (TPR) repeat protein
MADQLPDDLRNVIQATLTKGDQLLDSNEYAQAEKLYREALSMIPKPHYYYDLALPAYLGLGESLFYDWKYEEALQAFNEALKAPGGTANPLVAFRLGQAYYELGDRPAAVNAFGGACLLGGDDLFQGEENDEYRALVAPLLSLGDNSEPDASEDPTAES